ncbi:MAG: hypothetical protein FWC49_03195 [Proteobacteria bacterium]|nr:hypothetical protein [Pseudomonadota bacterium]
MLDAAKLLIRKDGSQIDLDRPPIGFDPRDLIRELLAYGEIEAADKLLQLDRKAIVAIGVLAMRYYSAPDRPILDKAICLGIVEFLEEKPRPLKRKRRVYPKN